MTNYTACKVFKITQPIYTEWNFPPLSNGHFSFYLNFNRTFYKQIVETLIRPRVLRRLIGACAIAYVPQKDARLIPVK